MTYENQVKNSGGIGTTFSYRRPTTPILIDPPRKPLLHWTPELHKLFLRAVENLGGPEGNKNDLFF